MLKQLSKLAVLLSELFGDGQQVKAKQTEEAAQKKTEEADQYFKKIKKKANSILTDLANRQKALIRRENVIAQRSSISKEREARLMQDESEIANIKQDLLMKREKLNKALD